MRRWSRASVRRCVVRNRGVDASSKGSDVIVETRWASSAASWGVWKAWGAATSVSMT